MSSPDKLRWLSEDVALAVHDAQIAEHGGAIGVRDPGLLASALARPKNAAVYSDTDVPALGALYALGIIKDHPFVDGNKRVGAVLLELFLEDHGYELDATDADLLVTILGVAAGELSDEAFVSWVRRQTRPTS